MLLDEIFHIETLFCWDSLDLIAMFKLICSNSIVDPLLHQIHDDEISSQLLMLDHFIFLFTITLLIFRPIFKAVKTFKILWRNYKKNLHFYLKICR